ncbi:STAS domain-containing protein [Streptosporangium sp. NPDC023615]|uniref:STAS domain-containing protein n=1 Tax=Streptosporangium sp. NPDC023615 TaxID=3154794 RepID=UPI003448CCB1
MPPEDVNILSMSIDTYGGAIVVRATGELDYDYAPVFRRELTRVWRTDAGTSSAEPSPPREPSPAFPGTSPLLPERPFSPVTSPPAPPPPAVSSPAASPPAVSPLTTSPSAVSPSLLAARSAFPSGAAAGTAPSWIILDLTGLTFCDSTGLAELLWSLRRSQETGTRLVLAGASRTLRHMLSITGLLAFFTMAGSVEEALLEAGTGTPGEG